MSGFFVKLFKKENKCPKCPKKKLKRGDKTYSLCTNHLLRARAAWENWTERRRDEAKCCYCHRASYNGWLRCRIHTLINRENCRNWTIRNYDAVKAKDRAYWAAKKGLPDRGFCANCKDQRPIEPGYRRCAPCRQRRRMVAADRNHVFVGGVAVRGRGLAW